MVAHTCNPSTLGGRGRQISEFEASLVYRVSEFQDSQGYTEKPRLQKAKSKKPKTKKKKNQKPKKISLSQELIPALEPSLSPGRFARRL